MNEHNNESKGALIGSIIIVLVLIAGGIFFARQAHETSQEITEIDQVLSEDQELQNLQDQPAPENLDGLDGELGEIDLGELENIDIDSLEF
jgi:hypothetical protein